MDRFRKVDRSDKKFRRPGNWTAVDSWIATKAPYMERSLPARHLHLVAWLYSNRELTDGLLTPHQFRIVTAEAQLSELESAAAADELIESGLWNLHGDFYELVDFLKWNLPAVEVKKRKDENRAAVQAFREAQKNRRTEERTELTEEQVHNPLRNGLQDQEDEVGPEQRRANVQRFRTDWEEKLRPQVDSAPQ